MEKLMSDLADTLNTLNATLDATSQKLDKVTGEQASLLEAVADLTDKLAAALAAGKEIPAEVIAAASKAKATADAIKAKTDALDAMVVDIPAP
jgi:peptidoglycan hydrolase CwlO-like protein